AAPSDRARAAPRSAGRRPLRRARSRGLGAVLARAFRPRPGGPLLGGKDRRCLRLPSLLDSGAVVANGSDAPIEELDPLAGIRAAVQRDWHAEQALTVQQAFEASTLAPAWLAGDERRRGKLLPGYAADLVVLDRDPWEHLEAQVVATMVAGRWVHNPPPWS